MAAVLAVTEPGNEAGWLLTELDHRGVILVDRRKHAPRHLQFDEGLVVAPFCTCDQLAEHLHTVSDNWHELVAILHIGPERLDTLMA
jgi:hypothetical protein